MYDEILFPVSFYLLDHNELADHVVEIASAFGASVHVLSLTLSQEGRQDVEDHRNAFDSFETHLRDEGVDLSTELRDEPIGYDEVADAIVDEVSGGGYDAVLVGHTKVRDGSERTTAEALINRLSVPVFVVPMSTPRFRDV